MSDLFHEDVPDEYLDRVFAVMALAQPHTFIVLTKRPERMREYLTAGRSNPVGRVVLERVLEAQVRDRGSQLGSGVVLTGDVVHLKAWPLPNVWGLVSCEDQQRADERIPILLDTPLAVRGVSAEPLLAALDLSPWLPALSWVIVGGESGKGARPMDLAWARSIVEQCRAASVPAFVKQLGARQWAAPGVYAPRLRHSHGADPDEWPEDLRVREWPR